MPQWLHVLNINVAFALTSTGTIEKLCLLSFEPRIQSVIISLTPFNRAHYLRKILLDRRLLRLRFHTLFRVSQKDFL